MYSDENLVLLSALQHLLFCRRQCALIHLEQLWTENVFTAEGRVLHEKTDTPGHETRGDLRIARALKLRSLRLGICGQADTVEFHRQPDGVWIPFPVEYKRGRTKINDCDRIQLCAQALCLEEMKQVAVPAGALFYGQNRRREEVFFDEPLRSRTESACAEMHELIESGVTPPPVYEKTKCDACSLQTKCLPHVSSVKSVRAYLDALS